MVFKYVGQDSTNGCERWFDSETGDVQLRNCPDFKQIPTEVSQSTPAKDPTKETFTQSELNSITEGIPTFTKDQVNKDLTAGTAPSKPGTITNDDASINNTKSGTNTAFNAATNPSNPITPSPNVLDQFASYTYNLSWYLLTPQQANVMASTSKINTNEWSLLVQTGGAAPPVTPSAPPPAAPTPPATQTKPVTASYNADGTVNANDANAYGAG